MKTATATTAKIRPTAIRGVTDMGSSFDWGWS
jgi:hypothetical protein